MHFMSSRHARAGFALDEHGVDGGDKGRAPSTGACGGSAAQDGVHGDCIERRTCIVPARRSRWAVCALHSRPCGQMAAWNPTVLALTTVHGVVGVHAKDVCPSRRSPSSLSCDDNISQCEGALNSHSQTTRPLASLSPCARTECRLCVSRSCSTLLRSLLQPPLPPALSMPPCRRRRYHCS